MTSNDTPIFSIIITSHNYGNFLPSAIDSVFCQNFHSFEIIVVDDASSDNTFEVAAAYGDSINYYRLDQNVGAAKAWAFGLAQAKGAYLCKLDADDCQLPGFLNAVYAAFLSDPGIGFVATSVFLRHGDVDEIEYLVKSDTTLEAIVFRRRLLQRFFFRMPGTAIRKEAILNTPQPLAALYQIHDWEFILRALRGWKATLISQPLAIYRIHSHSVTATARINSRLENDLQIFLDVATKLGPHHISDIDLGILACGMTRLLIEGIQLPYTPKKMVRFFQACKTATSIARRSDKQPHIYVARIVVVDMLKRFLQSLRIIHRHSFI